MRSAPAASIVITGASSGIGRALALHYAAPGISLGLIARDGERLEDCAAQCRKQGAAVRTARIDVTNRAEIAAWLTAYDRDHPIDLLIVNAGVSAGAQPDGNLETSKAAFAAFDVNVIGSINTALPPLEAMIKRGRGQIAFLSSIAALYPLPSTPSYSASKAAMRYYGLALRQALSKHGVKVNVVCPGYVASPMSERVIGYKPFLISADRAAHMIARGLERNQAIIAFPFLLAAGTRILNLLPASLAQWFAQLFALRVRSDERMTRTNAR